MRGDSTGLDKDLDGAAKKTTGWASKLGGSVGKLVGGLAVAGVAAVGAAIVGIGAAAIGVQGDFKLATDAIIKGTGASGEALKEMDTITRSLKTSSSGLGKSYEDIGSVIAEVNTRTGATGETLQGLSADILDFSRLTGGDGVTNTQLFTRVMGDWGVSMDDAAGKLDQIYGAGQAFGIGTDDLMRKVVQFGAPLRQMGFSLEDSIALFGKWEKEGVNAELVIGSLRIAAGEFARTGVDLKTGLADVQERIKGAATESEALNIAMETFGARAGPDMAAAIREGRFELDEAIAALQGTQGGLADAAARTIGFREQWQIAMSSMKDALLPLGEKMGELTAKAMPYVIEGFKGIVAATVPVIDWLVKAGDTVGGLIGWFKDKLPSSIGVSTKSFGIIGEWVQTNMPLMRATVETVLSAITGFWERNGDNIMRIVTAMWTVVKSIFDLTLKNILDVVKLAMQLITGDMEGAGETIKGIFSRTFETILGIAATWGGALWDTLTSIDWGGLGLAIVQGIANGLAGAGHLLVNAAQGAAQGAVDGIKGMLGIHSPSRVMAAQVGLPMAQGMMEGLRAGVEDMRLSLAPMNLAAAGMGGGTNINVTIPQTFNGQADAGAVRRAAANGVDSVLAMRRQRGG